MLLPSNGSGLSLLGLDLRGDAVQIPAALRGETTAAVGVLLHPLQGLQGLQALAGDRAGTAAPVRGGGAVVLAD